MRTPSLKVNNTKERINHFHIHSGGFWAVSLSTVHLQRSASIAANFHKVHPNSNPNNADGETPSSLLSTITLPCLRADITASSGAQY